MFRSAVSRTTLRRSLNASFQPTFRAVNTPIRSQFHSQLCAAARRPQALALAKPLLISRFADERKPGSFDQIDTKHEQDIRGKTITPHPELVSSSSSVHPVNSEIGVEESGERETDMMAGVKADMVRIPHAKLMLTCIDTQALACPTSGQSGH